MFFVIRIIGRADGVPSRYNNTFLSGFNPEDNGGLGSFEITADIKAAIKFNSVAEATILWNTQSKTHPYRQSDGKPNKPLTAFTIQICRSTV